ncbi:MAG: ABC transporter ATP-binding protein [Rhodospirillales bacterium]|jgi:putative ABC transport system ATP-binding protein|nr:ABC transporter ATP-binding protein [Rhodospirillales bacterium]
MSELVIETEGLCKDYRVGSQVVHALVDLSVGIHRGEFVAVMGPSGSGKSTFMHLLGCLDTPESGRYVFDGTDISLMDRDQLAATRNGHIGFVFQTFNLLARVSAQDNVAFPLMYARVPRTERRARAAQALEAVGLADRAHHHPAQLSGGQQQRVAIARALVNNPTLILADEPTGALDTATGAEIMTLFQNLNDQGITIIVVTHEPEVAAFAGRALHFRDGRLVADGPTGREGDAQ